MLTMLYIVVTATDCCGAAIGVVDASCAVASKAVITAVFAVRDMLVLGVLTTMPPLFWVVLKYARALVSSLVLNADVQKGPPPHPAGQT